MVFNIIMSNVLFIFWLAIYWMLTSWNEISKEPFNFFQICIMVSTTIVCVLLGYAIWKGDNNSWSEKKKKKYTS